ncbi:unnamed protein product [Peniophora sp. CBMAI 1063]|nr:unnamed protein product [Peniophora sp. CBMAI 1063]
MAQAPQNNAPNAGSASIGPDTTFVNPSDKFWSLYIEDAEKYDKVRLERWKGDTDGILIFTGLFAATVATFVVSTIPSLCPDSGDQSAVLLAQVLSVLVNNTDNGTLPDGAPPSYSFEASTSSVWINSLWLVSLFLSLVCALGATLAQQWARIYLQQVQRRGSPSVRGPQYAALTQELENFHMEDVITWVISMLHVAVLLFFAGLPILIYPTDRRVGIVLAADVSLAL